ncbi:MAG: WXG100 family type VII secretion target [Oscillospiraceae bacterium]|nr:WXG100 family type VII secretion target [Oscillospiraceae bacterium]
MAKIKVDYKELEKTADEVKSYIEAHRALMKEIDAEVSALGTEWQGEDYEHTKKEWAEMKGKESTSEKMLRELDSYEELLRYAAKRYRDAQKTVVQMANKLPRW